MANTDRSIKYTAFKKGPKAPSYTPKPGESHAKQELSQLKSLSKTKK